ncbi:MAG: alpha/beta hydrolase [Anaerolineae bacterium]
MAAEWLVSRFVYFPLRGYWATPERYGLPFEDVFLATGDGAAIHGWWFPAEQSVAALLFCHGNAGNISHRLENVAGLVGAGFSVFIFDYRGYGQSRGRPSEAGLAADARAAWARLRQLAPPGKPRLVFGRSLGGAVAIGLAAEAGPDGPDGLIVESSFTGLGAMAAKVLRLPRLERLVRGYPSLERLERVRAPMLVIHGTADDLIPFEHGQQLFAAANSPKQFYAVPGGGHNDTWLVGGAEYFERLAAFAKSCAAG